MRRDFFVAIDFDGTIIEQDITDAVIQKFAKPGWEIPERLWETGGMGSRECLEIQMSLINEPLENILDYIDRFSIDAKFAGFISLLTEVGVSFAIVSDGFRIFVERLLRNAGFSELPPVYANDFLKKRFGLKAVFPNTERQCLSGTCKCSVVENSSEGRPIILIGDGRSDFCLARKAEYVFSKGRLSEFCSDNGLRYKAFEDFSDVAQYIQEIIEIVPVSCKTRIINKDIEDGHICNLIH